MIINNILSIFAFAICCVIYASAIAVWPIFEISFAYRSNKILANCSNIDGYVTTSVSALGWFKCISVLQIIYLFWFLFLGLVLVCKKTRITQLCDIIMYFTLVLAIAISAFVIIGFFLAFGDCANSNDKNFILVVTCANIVNNVCTYMLPIYLLFRHFNIVRITNGDHAV